MACINPDGTISDSAKGMLKILQTPMTAEQVAQQTGHPLFRVRSSLRELVDGGLVKLEADRYSITEEGKEKIG